MTTPTRKRRTSEGESSSKVALLDAAEELFALHGYLGTTVRDITKLAGVPHGLATYYFQTKDDLFLAVVARRLPDVMAGLDVALARDLATGRGGMEMLEAIVDAYLCAHLQFAARGERELSYLRLSQQTLAVGKRQYLMRDVIDVYMPIYHKYLAALSAAVPDQDARLLELRFHLMRLTLAGLLLELETPFSLDPSGLEETRRILGAYCTRGFYEMVQAGDAG